MSQVAIVADSSACLPQDLIDRHGITIVPMGLLIEGQVYADRSMSSAELFRRIDSATSRVQTASPAPGEFLAAFERLRSEGAESLLCLTLSAKFSGTYSAAAAARDMAREKLPGLDVRAVDTGGLAMTHGFAVLTAARVLESGGTADEAQRAATEVGARGRLVGALETLSYLVKGGRVPRVVGWAASALRIRPLLAFEHGEARSVGRARTWSGAEARLLNYLAQNAGEARLHVAVMHTDAPDVARELTETLCERFRPAETLVTQFTSVMAVHTGPGFAGVAFYTE